MANEQVMRAALEQIAQDEDCQYGYFPGGDPRTFSPDHESCTEEEMAAHKAACKVWSDAEAEGRSMNPEAPAGQWLKSDDGNAAMHILRAKFGIGTYTYPTRAAEIARRALKELS